MKSAPIEGLIMVTKKITRTNVRNIRCKKQPFQGGRTVPNIKVLGDTGV